MAWRTITTRTLTYRPNPAWAASSVSISRAPPATHWDRERGLDNHSYIVPGAGGAERIIAMSKYDDRRAVATAFGATDLVAERGEEGEQVIADLKADDLAAVRQSRMGHFLPLRRPGLYDI